MNIQYRKEGDYFVPVWEIPESQQKPLGLYGPRHTLRNIVLDCTPE